MGTTLQIVPSGNLPLQNLRNNGKLIICNLQKTKHDSKSEFVIHAPVDDIMRKLLLLYNIPLPNYSIDKDPTKNNFFINFEWNISYKIIKELELKLKMKRMNKEFHHI